MGRVSFVFVGGFVGVIRDVFLRFMILAEEEVRKVVMGFSFLIFSS